MATLKISQEILNIIYPVGSIYMSTNSTNPSTLFGGAWKQIKDRFLLACGDSYSNGSTGGEATHTLTVNEMPNHSHYNGCGNFWDWGQGGDRMLIGSGYGYTIGTPDGYYIGGNQPHNNMPPYLTVYMWYRTA